MLLPNFIGIGAPRCGTRWLSKCLSEHPQIALPPEEVYFFTNRRVVHSFYCRGLGWYSNLFTQLAKPNVTKMFGEITPVYMFDEDTPHLIHKNIPNVKLMCIVRDQTERAYSWYRFFLKIHPEFIDSSYSFRQFLTYNPEAYGREGFYLEHIQRYLKLFPLESITVLLYDDLRNNPKNLIKQVFSFIGVDETFLPPSLDKIINVVNPDMVRSEIIRGYASRICHRKGFKMFSMLLNKLNKLPYENKKLPVRHQLDPEMRNRMAQLYKSHNKKLGDFLGRDLTLWNRDT